MSNVLTVPVTIPTEIQKSHQESEKQTLLKEAMQRNRAEWIVTIDFPIHLPWLESKVWSGVMTRGLAELFARRVRENFRNLDVIVELDLETAREISASP
jgi:hypothetical protein